MILVRIHTTIGHTPDADVLMAESEAYASFIEQIQTVVERFRRDNHRTANTGRQTDMNVTRTEDVVPEEIHFCPGCGGRGAADL